MMSTKFSKNHENWWDIFVLKKVLYNTQLWLVKGVKKQNNTLSFFKYIFNFHMDSTKLRLKQFKPTIKGLWKVRHEPLFFDVLQVFYKVHEAHCTEEF